MKLMHELNRRSLLRMLPAGILLGAGSRLTGASKLRIIAHRGGVVDDTHPENSVGSVKAAIERGYWMIEVDVRRTKDGHAILNHDANAKRAYGVDRKISEMDWEEIAKLRSLRDQSKPMQFRDLAELCRGKMRLMLDVKEEPHPEAFYKLLMDELREHRLLQSTYVLSGADTERAMAGTGPLAATRGVGLQDALSRGERHLDKTYYVFEDARTISPETIALARQHGVDVIAEVNEFQYRGDNAMDLAKAALKRAVDLGVDAFQIDSLYEPHLRSLVGNAH